MTIRPRRRADLFACGKSHPSSARHGCSAGGEGLNHTGLRDRNSSTCTLSQNGYVNENIIYDSTILLAGLRGGGGPTWRGNASPIRTRRHMPEHPQAHTRATSCPPPALSPLRLLLLLLPSLSIPRSLSVSFSLPPRVSLSLSLALSLPPSARPRVPHTDPLSPSLACVEAVVPPGEATLLPSDHGGACQSTSDQRLDHNHDAARNASPRNARRY